jgi:hypothetical protein
MPHCALPRVWTLCSTAESCRALCTTHEPSCPSSTGRAYKRISPCAFCPRCLCLLSTPVSRRRFPCFASTAASMDTPPPCIPSPPCRSQSTTVPRNCFPTRPTSTFDAGERSRRRHAGELLPRRRPPSSSQARAQDPTVLVRHGPWIAVVSTLSSIGHQ